MLNGELYDPFEREIHVVSGGFEHKLVSGMKEFISEHEKEICEELYSDSRHTHV